MILNIATKKQIKSTKSNCKCKIYVVKYSEYCGCFIIKGFFENENIEFWIIESGLCLYG